MHVDLFAWPFGVGRLAPPMECVLRMSFDRCLGGAFSPFPLIYVAFFACRPGVGRLAPPRRFISMREPQKRLGVFSRGAIPRLALP